jgi:DNA-binding winged helix-turn-helix (wHTH) protein
LAHNEAVAAHREALWACAGMRGGSMTGWLIERGGTPSGKVYPLEDALVTIGRDANNTVMLADYRISRRHAEIAGDGGNYVLHDMGSKNGTLVNGSRVTAPQPLVAGDIISFPGLPGVELAFSTGEETVLVTRQEQAARPIVLDPRTAEVRVRGLLVKLTPKEYFALAVLYEQAEGLVKKEEFAARVWPELEGLVGDDSIEQVVSRLRRKIEENPDQPRYLLTVRGLGYRLITS